MKTRLGGLMLSLFLVGILGLVENFSPAFAELDEDLGADIKFWNDTEVYITVSSRYFGMEPDRVRRWSRQCAHSDDLAVALFIARHSGQSPSFILTLRNEGAAWWDISVGLGLDPDVWFVPVTGDPGPPYGKAYGHWKNGQKSPQRMTITDTDCRNLVAVQVLMDYYGVTVEAAMDWRASGQPLKNLTATEYRRRHVKKAMLIGPMGTPTPFF